ncbi:MAG: caspase family protein [Nitrosomonadales bacterium]|nr:caspase family protein [Nitrosomonadales bacterium]
MPTLRANESGLNPNNPLVSISPPPCRGRAREGVETLHSHRANPHPNLPPARGKEQFGSNGFSGLKITALIIAACFSPLALANPVGPVVVNGAATVANNGNTLTVTNTPGAILNWQQFNIGQGQTTQFNQQSAQSSVLNRVTGPDASQIMGTLRSNGQVFLSNPNGILFGAGSVIDVHRLIASTLNITNADFLANNLKFDGNNGTSVINQGAITTPVGGSVYLIGNNVTNEGVITTPQGEVILAAGNSVSMVNSFTPHVNVTMSAPAGGQAVNLGQVTAQGGQINIYGALIRQHGIVNADSASVDKQGNIVFSATQSVELAQGSSTTANGPTGGNITIESSGAGGITTVAGVVAASGSNGAGGNIKIFGNMQTGTVNLSGTLDASASITPFAGEGRGEGVDGGFIETSAAHINIADTARVTTAAAACPEPCRRGKSGIWLIDPFDFTIAATGGNITGATLSSSLGGGNVSILSSSGTAGTAGDVNVNDTVAWNANKLTLNARNNININATMNGSGTASLALEYGQAAVAAGNLSDYIVHAAVNLPAGNNFSTRLGSDGAVKNYTVITSLGVAGSVTGTDLQGMGGNLAGNYALGSNIDATATSAWNAGAGFAPVGDSFTGFTGNFDGLGHTVSNLTINRPTTNDVGLFGYTDTGSVIRNVGMVGGSVSGAWSVGALVGGNIGTVSSSYATGNVSGFYGIGGLVGINYFVGTVSNSYATGSVSGSFEDIGGLVGENYGGTVSNSYWDTATAGVTVTNGIGIGDGFDNDNGIGLPSDIGATGLTSAQMKTMSSFTGWNIANTGGAGAIWRIYEGSTAPLLTSFLTPLTVTAGNASKTYNGTAYSGGNGVAYSVVNPVLSGTLAYGGSSQGAANAGSYTITASGLYSDQQGYDISYVNGALTVNKAALSVTANAASKTYDGLAYSGGDGVVYSGFVNSETNAVLGGALSYGGTSQGAASAGSYLITPGGLTSGNYTLSYVDGTLTIVAVTQTCLTNPVLCASSPTISNPTTTTAPVGSTAPATGKITYDATNGIDKEVSETKKEARKAGDEAEKAEKREKEAKTPKEKSAARQHAEIKSGEADVKRAEAKIREAETELRAAETEVASVKSPQEKVRAETRKAIAEAKRAEGEVDKATAEAKLAEAEAKVASVPGAKAAAEMKKAEAEAKKVEAEAKKTEVEIRKAETELKQAEAEAKTGGSTEAKAVVEAKKAEVEAKKADAEIRQTEREAKSAKDPAAKAAAEAKLAAAEAKKADVEARQADADARSSNSPVAKLVAETKKAEADARKAEAEAKKAGAEVKSANEPERKAKAEVKVVEAEARKADAEAKKAEAEVKVAEVRAKNSNNAEDRKDVEGKKAEAEVKKADAQVKKAEAEAKTAKAPGEKEAAEIKRSKAEVKKVEAELKHAEFEAKRDKDEAGAPQSGYFKNVVVKKAEASVAKAEAKQAELEMKQAKTPEARASAEKRLEAKRAEADRKETEFKDAKRSSDSKIIETFGGMALASTAKERVQEAMVARHEFKAETLKPALNILKADPKAADLKPCSAGGGDVCIRPVNAAIANIATNIIPRVQLPLLTPTVSFLPAIQRKVAVVIGNNAYQDSSLPSLNGAAKDADAVSKMLKEKMGYDVRMVHNGTRADIVRTLNRVSDETGSKDSVVVYYAGHGYQMEDTKVGYWIPSDASAEDPNKWISNSDVNKMLANIPAKQMILMSDSCFSGTLAGEQKVTSGSVAGSSVQEILGKRSVLVMSSGGEEPVIDEGKEGHSVFAWHLMDKLNKVEQYKNGADVFDAVKAGVAKDGIPQTPQYGASVSAGHMAGGEYLFEVQKY